MKVIVTGLRRIKSAPAQTSLNKLWQRRFGLIFSTALFVSAGGIMAQNNNICEKAVAINTSSDIIVSCNGAPDQFCTRYLHKEHNVAWLTFIVPSDTVLTFDIIPSNSAHNLNFLLFKDSTGNFCGNIISTCPVPLRFNIANALTNQSNATGISFTAEHNAGIQDSNTRYCKPLKVKKGERYYILVDDITGQGTFNFHLHLAFANDAANPVQGVSVIDARPVKVGPLSKNSKCTLTIKVTDSAGAPLKADVYIYGLTSGNAVKRSFAVDSFALDSLQKIALYCHRYGYVFSNITYTAFSNSGKTTVNIILQRIRKNATFILGGVSFEPKEADILPGSETTLKNLLTFLLMNPDLKITISGYVNNPYNDEPGRARRLSEKRAKAVYDYLRIDGIKPRRLKYRGCGNDKMLFPHPVNDYQEQTNRRVEIRID